jgi:hypothetical protein
VNWEYKVSNAPTTPRELQVILDRDGAEQWELVSTTLIASRLLLLFKRPFEYAEGTEIAEETPSLQESETVEESIDTFSEVSEEPAS